MTDTVLDTSSTNVSLSMNGVVFGSIDATAVSGSFDPSFDHDWFAVSLTAGHNYAFSAFSTSGTLNDMAIALRDASRNILNSQGVVDGGINRSASFVYTAAATATYYLAVSAGGNNPGSVTGTYDVFVNDIGVDTVLDTSSTSASLTINGTVTGQIDPVPESGSFDLSFDHDWFAVSLTAGHSYAFTAFNTSGNLNDIAIDLNNANRTILNNQGLVDGGPGGSPNFTYTAAVSGTYYLAVSAGGSNPASLTGNYQITVFDNGVAPSDTVLDTSSTNASLTMNGSTFGTIEALPASGSFDTSFDHDWLAVSLTAGHSYRFSAIGTSGGLNDVAIDLNSANRTILNSQGVVDGGAGGLAVFTYTAPATGTYYLAVSAGGSNPASLIGNYQITATDNGVPPSHLVINLLADQSVIAQFGANYQSSAFWTAVRSAASYFETNFLDPISININVGWGEVAGSAVASREARSLRNQTSYTFNQIVAALRSDAASASDATAVANLPLQDPGSGADFRIANAEAKALGLSLGAGAPTTDGSVGFATDWSPTDANFVGVVEHEISEIMGRASGINATSGVFGGQFSVLDLFRYFGPPITPEPASAHGPNGQGATYFSIDGGQTALNTFSGTAGQDPGGDWATRGDNDAFDAILNVGPAAVTAIDAIELDVLGYDTQSPHSVTTVVETNGSTRLVEVGNNFFLDAVVGSVGPELKYAGAPVAVGEFGGAWTPVAAERTASGYEVAWKEANTGQFTAWSTDSAGNFATNTIGVVPGTDGGLEALEPSFHQDLNGDRTIGPFGPPASPTVIEAFGSTSLTQIGSNYFLYANGTTTGPELKYQGAPVTTAQFGAWGLIGGEQTSGGYEVAFKNASTGQFTAWSTDGNGNYLANAIGVVSGTDAALEALEPSFHQDLNGDLTIGPTVSTTVIESFGATSLTQVGNNYFLYANGTTTGPELTYQGAPVTTGQFGAGWTLIGGERTSSGYEAAWTNGSQFTAWSTDGNGNYMGNTLGVVSGTDAGLEALEPSFHQDLNGDLTIGPTVSTTVIEAFGSTSLTQVGNNYFLYANGTTTGPELKYQGAPVMAGGFGAGWTPIGGEQTSSGYEVAWKDASTGQFTTWNTDSDGNYIANAIGVVSSADPSLQALEPSFHQNLNGDGVIGLAGAGGSTLSSAGGGTVVVVGGATVQSGNLLEAGTIGSFTGDLTNHAMLVHAIAANLTSSASVYAVGQVSTAASTQPELIMAAAVQTGH